MVNIKSKDTLISELKTFLNAYNKNLDTGENSLIKDLILLPFSIGGEGIMNQVAIARDLHILSSLTGSDLDNEGSNYKLERLLGTYATTTITFYADSIPADPAGVTIPANTTVSTIGSSLNSPLDYTTVYDVTVRSSDFSSYYTYDRNRYEISIPAICSTLGNSGNVSAGYITFLKSSISGIDGATNLTAAVGGTNQESDEDFRKRIQTAMTGRDLNTVNGLKSYVTSLGFLDAYPIRVESSDSERATGIDIFVINSVESVQTDTFVYDPAQTNYSFSKLPALTVGSVTGSIIGTLSPSYYDVVLDSTSPLKRSTQAIDYIRIHGDSPLSYGETLTVVYTYASQLAQTQDTLSSNDNKILTADPLLKMAYPLDLYITARLVLKANADGPTTRTNVKNALAQFLATYRLGDDVQKSDLVVVLQTGYGDYPITSVDYVVISSYYLVDEYGTVYSPVNEVISVNNKQYAQYGSATLT